MKTIILAGVLAAGLASSAWADDYAAEVKQDQNDIQSYRAARVAAFKTHDQAAIAKTKQQLQAAYVKLWDDQAAAKAATAPLLPGETRAAQQAVVSAKENYEDAQASGDKAAIAKARAELRAAYNNDWAVRHPKHPATQARH